MEALEEEKIRAHMKACFLNRVKDASVVTDAFFPEASTRQTFLSWVYGHGKVGSF